MIAVVTLFSRPSIIIIITIIILTYKALYHRVYLKHTLGKITSWSRDTNSRDRDVSLPRRDRDVVIFCRDESDTRCWCVLRPICQDRDHIPASEISLAIPGICQSPILSFGDVVVLFYWSLMMT